MLGYVRENLDSDLSVQTLAALIGMSASGFAHILMTGLWTEVCVTWPTIEMLGAGYNVYVVDDCCGATSVAAHDAALSRMV